MAHRAINYNKYYNWIDHPLHSLHHIKSMNSEDVKSQFISYILELSYTYKYYIATRRLDYDLAILQALIDHNVDVNAIHDDYSILQYLIPFPQLAQVLLPYVTNLEHCNPHGDTVFLMACRLVSPLIIDLQRYHCNINALDRYGASALHLISKYTLIYNKPEGIVILKELIQHIDVNIVDVYGNTCLHYLELTPRENIDLGLELCQLLLDYGCDPYINNKLGLTVYDILDYCPELQVIQNILV